MAGFKSDFSLFPIKKLGRPGWEFRLATWPNQIDPEVHKLFDGQISDSITYIRKRNFDGKVQHCKIIKEKDEDGDDQFILHPGDGYNFLVRRDSTNNKEPDVIDVDNSSVPHDMLCLICLDNKKTHVILPCFHVVACVVCANELFKSSKKECPLCREPFGQPLKKLFF